MTNAKINRLVEAIKRRVPSGFILVITPEKPGEQGMCAHARLTKEQALEVAKDFVKHYEGQQGTSKIVLPRD